MPVYFCCNHNAETSDNLSPYHQNNDHNQSDKKKLFRGQLRLPSSSSVILVFERIENQMTENRLVPTICLLVSEQLGQKMLDLASLKMTPSYKFVRMTRIYRVSSLTMLVVANRMEMLKT